MFCTDIRYPLTADIYYSITSQDNYGNVNRIWSKDQEIKLELAMSTNYKDQQMQPDMMFWMMDILNGTANKDPRVALNGETHSMTNVLFTNIKDVCGEQIYVETAGEREGKGTVWELAGVLPHNGPFGKVDYYKVVLRRSDRQELLD